MVGIRSMQNAHDQHPTDKTCLYNTQYTYILDYMMMITLLPFLWSNMESNVLLF